RVLVGFLIFYFLLLLYFFFFFFFSSRRRHTRSKRDWSSDVSLPIFSKPSLTSCSVACSVATGSGKRVFGSPRHSSLTQSAPALPRLVSSSRAKRACRMASSALKQRSEERRVG